MPRQCRWLVSSDTSEDAVAAIVFKVREVTSLECRNTKMKIKMLIGTMFNTRAWRIVLNQA